MLLLTTIPYSAHSSDPWFHSWYSPMIKMIINNVLIVAHDIMFDLVITTVIGNKSAISTSNTKNIIAIRKNRRENGSRADPMGSNPHSNGDLFSRSSIFFFDIAVAIIIMIIDSVMVTVIIVVTIFIIYLIFWTSWLEVKYTFYIR